MRILPLLLVAFFVGCGSGDKVADELAKMTPMELSLAKTGFEDYVKFWEERIESGEWQAMIDNGEAEVPEKDYGGTLEDYPKWKINKFEEAISKFESELAKRR